MVIHFSLPKLGYFFKVNPCFIAKVYFKIEMKFEICKNVPAPILHLFSGTPNDMYLKLSTNVKTLKKLKYSTQSQVVFC